MNYCPHCGEYLKGGEAFCPNCGGVIGVSGNAGTPTPPKKKKKSKAWLWILIGVVALFVIIAAVTGGSGDGGDTSSNNDDYSYGDHFVNNGGNNSSINDSSYVIDESTVTSAPDNFTPDAGFTNKKTIMVYLVGSDLESEHGCASSDLVEMIESGCDTANTNLLVCTGGTTNWMIDAISTDKNTYYLLNGDEFSEVHSTSAKNMGESDTLAEFLTYCRNNYPADQFGLILWDHGGGPFGGFGVDTLHANDRLYMDELSSALNAGGFNSGNKLEFLGFDACLMGSVEVAWAVKDHADYFIASQELEPGDGWDYSFLKNVANAKNGEEVGRLIIDSYFDYYTALIAQNPKNKVDLTLSCVDLSAINQVETCVDNMFSKINGDDITYCYSNMSRLRNNTKVFGKISVSGSYDLIDLVHITDQLNEHFPEAKALKDALNGYICYSKTNVSNANGVSIYHPYDDIQNMNYCIDECAAMGFSDDYVSYLRGFAAKLAAGDKNMSGFRNFGSVEATVTGSANANKISIQLTPEQAENMAYARYHVFQKLDPSQTFSKEEEYLLVYTGEPATLDANNRLVADYNGKAVYAVDNKTGKNLTGVLAMHRIYNGSDSNKFYFPCTFYDMADFADMDIKAVDWLMEFIDGKPTLLNAVPMNSDLNAPPKVLINPDDYQIYGFMNNAYFVKTDENGNTHLQSSGSIYGYELTDEQDFRLEFQDIPNKGEFFVWFAVTDIYGNTYSSGLVGIE